MREIDATWMRGGTSKCWVFRRDDLDVPDLSVDEVLLRLYGSPDHRQVDGVGGGTSTTSKAVILAPSGDPDVDVEYTFAQVGIEEAKVDWGSNCGNCSAVVAPFAIREGWVPAGQHETSVRPLLATTITSPGFAVTMAEVAMCGPGASPGSASNSTVRATPAILGPSHCCCRSPIPGARPYASSASLTTVVDSRRSRRTSRSSVMS